MGMAVDGQRYEVIDTGFDPEGQVAQTMPLIQRYAAEDAQNPLILSLAKFYAGSSKNAAEAAWRAAKDYLRFQNDQSIAASAVPQEPDFMVEVLRRPVDVFLLARQTGQLVDGDCDDHSMFAAAIGAALGAEVKFVTVAADPSEPYVLSHIYTVIDGVPCDASHGPFAGWEVPFEKVSRRVEWGLRPDWGPLWVLVGALVWHVWGGWISRKVKL
jgi:hypothetical protein